MATTIKMDLIKLRRLKGEAATLAKRAKEKGFERDAWERHCFSRLEANDFESIKTGENLFARSSTEYASVQDRDVAVEWFKEHMPELVTETVAAGLLNTEVRRRLNDNEELPPGIGFYTKDIISIRKA